MSSTTTNFNLHKIDLTDAPPDITVLNQNWDTIDEELSNRPALDSSGKIPSSNLPDMNYIPTSEKGQASGVASLGTDGKVPSSQLPSMDYVPTTRTVNGKALSSDITLSASDVGLGNVPNVAVNDQTPTYSEASSLTNITSGEKLSTAFGKIKKAITDLISHLASTSNPHSVTATQAGALPISGGTLTGDLILDEQSGANGQGTLYKYHSDWYDYGTRLKDETADGDLMTLVLRSSNQTAYLEMAEAGGSSSMYDLYTEKNITKGTTEVSGLADGAIHLVYE